MLSGKTVCPHCGGKAVLKYQKANGKRYTYLTCGERRRAAVLTGGKPCTGDLYPLSFMEECTARVVQEVCQKPESLAAAEWVYDQPEADDTPALRKELTALDAALGVLTAEQEVAVRAQVAGIMAGASPDAYASLFADIAARRKDMEDRRGRVTALLSARREGRGQGRVQQVSEALRRALEDAWQVLTDPAVPGVTKRDILLPIVEKVVCHKDGVEVVFAPGLFSQSTKEGAEGGGELIDYTTCIGINTQR